GGQRGRARRLRVVGAVALGAVVRGAVGERRVAGAVAGVLPLGGGAEAPAGADLLARRLGLFLGHVGPRLLARDRAGAARGIEAAGGAARVVAARLVHEHRDVLAREVDDLVVAGLVRHRLELVDLAVAVVVLAVADLDAGRAHGAVAAAPARHRAVAH